jgi:hypothetical protein
MTEWLRCMLKAHVEQSAGVQVPFSATYLRLRLIRHWQGWPSWLRRVTQVHIEQSAGVRIPFPAIHRRLRLIRQLSRDDRVVKVEGLRSSGEHPHGFDPRSLHYTAA